MKTKLRSLALRSFRSFVEPTKIELPESGLVLIQGASGNGKSSINLAIAHAFGFCPYPGTELQSWFSDDPFEVEVEMDTSSGPVTLSVGNRASLQVGGERIQGAKSIKERMDKILGIDPTLLAALTYRPQKKPGLFLSKTNGEMQEFLSVLLGLGKYEDAIETAKDNITLLEGTLQKADNRRFNAQTFLTQEQEVVLLEPEPVELQEALVQDILAELDQANKVFKKLEQELYDLRQEHDDASLSTKRSADAEIQAAKQVVPFTPIDSDKKEKEVALFEATVRVDKLERAHKEKERSRQVELSKLQLMLRETKHAEARIQELESEVGVLLSAKCPRCSQPWIKAVADADRLHKEIEALKVETAKIPSLQADILARTEPIPESPVLLSMREIVQSLHSDIAAIDAKTKAAGEVAKAEWEAYLARCLANRSQALLAINDKYRPSLDAANKAVNQARAQESEIEIRLTSAQDRLGWMKKENARLVSEAKFHEDRLHKKTAELKQAEEEVASVQKNLYAEQDWLQLLKHFMTAIFDEVLEEIAYNTNKMLASVPNVDHVTLRFKSEVVTAKGKVNKTIVPVLTIAGAERPLRSALSGGMATAVELAVDLAVRRVISARTGAAPGWLILDECFEGLGLPEKEACLELLKQEANDSLILVVDHMSEFKERYNVRLTVENENGRSRIT